MSFGRTNYRTGGTRGGQDQFKWEDVKNDKYRENYLGHSVNAPVGRWQKNKDLTWYAKASTADRAAAAREELALAKQRDEDLMNEALGLAPRKRSAPVGQLDASEVKELLKRGQSERDGLMVERVEGLGAAPTAVPGFDTEPKKTLAERYQEEMASGRVDDTYQLPGAVRTPGESAEDAKEARKLARKAEKAAKKLKKKEKKERKKERRAAKRDSSDERDRSRSLSRSRDRTRRSPERRKRSVSRSPSVKRHGVVRRSRSRSRSPYSSDRRLRRRDASRSRSRSLSRKHSARDSRAGRDRVRDRDRYHSRSRSDSRENLWRRRRSRSRSRSFRR